MESKGESRSQLDLSWVTCLFATRWLFGWILYNNFMGRANTFGDRGWRVQSTSREDMRIHQSLRSRPSYIYLHSRFHISGYTCSHHGHPHQSSVLVSCGHFFSICISTPSLSLSLFSSFLCFPHHHPPLSNPTSPPLPRSED